MSSPDVSILIVDDELAIRSLLLEILSPLYQCETVESAGEALGLLESHRFKVAIVDIGLPDTSGLGLCSHIVNRNPETAVIMISGNTDAESIADAMKAGATDFITKPFNLSDVVACVERAVSDDTQAGKI